MSQEYLRIIREMSQPQAPLATREVSKLRQLKGIEAVLFDIYGTLFISCSGDIGVGLSSSDEAQGSQEIGKTPEYPLADTLGKKFLELFAPGCNKAGSPVGEELPRARGKKEGSFTDWGKRLMECFRGKVHEIHRIKQQQGIRWPEVDVRQIWHSVITELNVGMACDDTSIDRWAIEYEVRTNPVWPMPNANDCIDRLGSANLTLGIISNAQFYTPLLFPALLDKQLEDLEIASEMQYYSYRCGRAKPDPWMYQRASEALAQIGIIPSQTLYVGNDMRNDILPASQIGFRTALVATDRRSLRLREGDPSIAHVTPDLVVTNLSDLVDCVLG